MPTLGGNSVSGDNHYTTSFFGGVIGLDGQALGPQDLYVTPIVPDETQFVGDFVPDQGSLADFTSGQDWLCKRIVGKLFVGMHQHENTTSGGTPPYAIIGAGFYVGRADDANQDVPDTNNSEIDPLALKNVRQPWMWRRTWFLSNASANPTAAFPDLAWSHLDNGALASSLDGPHIDIKVARRIRREERLWFVINGYGLSDMSANTDGDWSVPGQASFLLDYRVLGAMRKSNNRSTF